MSDLVEIQILMFRVAGTDDWRVECCNADGDGGCVAATFSGRGAEFFAGEHAITLRKVILGSLGAGAKVCIGVRAT